MFKLFGISFYSGFMVTFCCLTFSLTAQQTRPYYYYYNEKKDLALEPRQFVVVFEKDAAEHAARLAKQVPGLALHYTLAPVNAAVFESPLERTTLESMLFEDTMVYNVSPVYRTATGALWIATDRIILQAGSVETESEVERLCTEKGLEKQELFTFGAAVPPFSVYRAPRFRDPLDLANAIQEKRLTLFAQPDFTFQAQSDYVPNDNLFNQQTFLNRLNDIDIDATEAWDITRGNPNLVVAVIDGNGYDLGHADMAGKYTDPYDAVNNDNAPSATGADDNHGTPCAGLIGAATDNNLGVAGVAFGVKVMPVVIGFNLSGGNFSTNNTIIGRATAKIAGTAGVVAVSNSWGSSGTDAAREQLYTQMRQNCRNGLGAVVLGSAGNDNGNLLRYPGNFAGVVNVGASDQSDKRVNTDAWGSNYSMAVDVVAPGLNTYTIDRTGTSGYAGGAYGNFNGTSAACPIAAGVVGLMASVNPSLTGDEMAELLQLTAEKVGGYNYATLLPERPLGTWHFEMGYGRVNAFNAVKAAAAPKLAISNLNSTGVTASWTLIAGAQDYQFRYRVVGTSDWTLSAETQDTRVLSDLLPGTTYECQVAANFNPNLQGDFSILKSFTTPGAPVLTLRANQTNAPAVGIDLPLIVNANVAWAASSSQNWITLTPAAGTSDGIVTALITTNLSSNPRTAIIRLRGDSITRTLTITQAGAFNPALTVSPLSVTLPPRADTFSLNITSNVSWTGVDNQTWLTVPLAAGTGNGRIRLQFTANVGLSTRTATLTVNGGGFTRNITVTQPPANLTVSPPTLSVAAAAGNSSFNVTGNVVWAATDNQTWVTLSPASGTGNGTVNITYAANPTALSRSATITITGSGLTRVLTLTQAGAVVTDCTDDGEPSNNSWASAPLFALNKEKFSRLGVAGDVDYWRFSVSSNTAVILRLSGLVENFDLALLNASGTVLGSSELSNASDEYLELALTTGVYYVRISGKNNVFSANACYRLKASSTPLGLCQNSNEPANDALGTAPPATFNSYRFSQIAGASDVDYWKFENPADGVIHLELFNQNQDYALELLDANGVILGSSNKSGTAAESINRQSAAGTYYARVYGVGGAFSLRCYALEISNGNWLNLIPQAVDDRQDKYLEDDAFILTPNPTSGFFTLKVPDNQEFEVLVSNHLGQTVMRQTVAAVANFDAHLWPPGLYYLWLTNETVQKVMKIVVAD